MFGRCDHFSQGLKVMFFTIGAIYLVYLIYLLFRAYSELRAMPYFGKFDFFFLILNKLFVTFEFPSLINIQFPLSLSLYMYFQASTWMTIQYKFHIIKT